MLCGCDDHSQNNDGSKGMVMAPVRCYFFRIKMTASPQKIKWISTTGLVLNCGPKSECPRVQCEYVHPLLRIVVAVIHRKSPVLRLRASEQDGATVFFVDLLDDA